MIGLHPVPDIAPRGDDRLSPPAPGTDRAAGTAAIRLSDLTLGYDRQPAVHHLNAEFATGSMTALIGPNGAGKSTLLKGIVGLMKPLSGTIRFAGFTGADIAYLPQAAEVDRSFPLSVLDVISLGLWRRVGFIRAIRGDNLRRARQALSQVGLDGFENRPVGSLSGGQLQRTLFARLLVQDAPVILLDEPFAAIDQRTTADLVGLVERWHCEGRTIIAALHDFDQVRAHFPDALLLAREAVAFGPTNEVLRPENLRRARHFIEAWNEKAEFCDQSVTGSGPA